MKGREKAKRGKRKYDAKYDARSEMKF